MITKKEQEDFNKSLEPYAQIIKYTYDAINIKFIEDPVETLTKIRALTCYAVQLLTQVEVVVYDITAKESFETFVENYKAMAIKNK